MTFHIQFCLLVTLSAVAADYSSYIPQLTTTTLPGRVTATTFILDKPQCLFNQTSTNNVWLFVASSGVQLTTNQLSSSAPYSSFTTQGYYRTLRAAENTYPCNSVADYIRVGSETSCSDPDNCNGFLNSAYSYKVKFVVLNSNGVLVDQTAWSGPITLRQGKESSVIDTWPGRRSGGMIVITSILSVLLATFLVCLIGTFIVGRKNIICCKRTDKIEKTVPQELNMKDYKTHNAPKITAIYEQPMA